MTREEAITNLKMISVAFVEPVTKEQRKLIDDTFDMAIKALEQNESAEEWYRMFVEKLEQEPKTENDTITIPTNVLKFRGNGIVAYNVEWLKKHWKMEMHLVCGARMESEE